MPADFERAWWNFPWTALVWFIASVFIMAMFEFRGDVIKENDPELFNKRRWTVRVYAFLLGSINLTQVVMWIQLIDLFNFLLTSMLFFAFWRIEKGAKRQMARTMAIGTLVLALLTLVSFLEEASWGLWRFLETLV